MIFEFFADICPVLCKGNGYYDEGLCRCHPGWKGQECEIPANACEVPTCNGNGECVRGKCVCKQGYEGSDCGIGKYMKYYQNYKHTHT